MSPPNGRGTVDVNAATLLLAETPTVIVNDHVAVVGEWARPATVASAEQAATLIFDVKGSGLDATRRSSPMWLRQDSKRSFFAPAGKT